MRRLLSRLAVILTVAASVTASLPVSSGAAVAVAPCQARDVAKFEEWSHTVLVTGHYTAAQAVDVQLTCGIVQEGVTVRRVSESAPGPVAAIAQTISVQG